MVTQQFVCVGTHLKPNNAFKVTEGFGDQLPHVEERSLQERLYRDILSFGVLNLQLRSERVASPETSSGEDSLSYYGAKQASNVLTPSLQQQAFGTHTAIIPSPLQHVLPL